MAVETEERGRSTEKRSRWGPIDQKIIVPGLPTVLPNCLTQDQVDAYVLTMRLEELGRRLRTNDVLPIGDKRSPSPEPVYGSNGVQTNTRELRYRAKIEDERQKLIELGLSRIPGFRPPTDYKKLGKYTEKLYIPSQDFPDVNFMGLLIGPRGHTLKKMEHESGSKISIRGRGSIKEGKVSGNAHDDEDLHCLIVADTAEKVKRAVRAINRVIETATSVPDGQNEMKKLQLRQLAALNGTLRDDEIAICPNCGEPGHRRFECPAAKNITNSIICKICGGVGHVASDCMQKHDPRALAEARKRNALMENEYATLMAELGKDEPTAPPDSSAPWAQPAAPPVAPWAAAAGYGSGMAPDGSSMPWTPAQQVYTPYSSEPQMAAPGTTPYVVPATVGSYMAPGTQQYGAPGYGYDAQNAGYYGYDAYGYPQPAAPGTGGQDDLRPPGA